MGRRATSVHNTWLFAARQGLESLAKLEAIPPSGATLVVGAPKVATGSGGPSRSFAVRQSQPRMLANEGLGRVGFPNPQRLPKLVDHCRQGIRRRAKLFGGQLGQGRRP